MANLSEREAISEINSRFSLAEEFLPRLPLPFKSVRVASGLVIPTGATSIEPVEQSREPFFVRTSVLYSALREKYGSLSGFQDYLDGLENGLLGEEIKRFRLPSSDVMAVEFESLGEGLADWKISRPEPFALMGILEELSKEGKI